MISTAKNIILAKMQKVLGISCSVMQGAVSHYQGTTYHVIWLLCKEKRESDSLVGQNFLL